MRSILVVDDEPAIREMLIDLLEEMGYEVWGAGTGLHAKRLIQKLGMPDLILTDLMMPLMTGEELLTWIRAHDNLARLPIIVMTANEGKHLQLQDPPPIVMRKPFDLNEIEQTVSDLLKAS